jgi:hypothetical protein
VPVVNEFEWDEVNEEKVLRHRVSPDDVDDVLTQRYAIFRNKRARRGTYQVIGRDLTGRYLTVIIEPGSHGFGSWRPVTAWESDDDEKSKAKRQGA